MSNTTRLLCSSGAFSRYPDFTDYRLIPEYGPQLAVDGIEVMFYPGWYAELEHVGADLRASGLHFPALHTEKSIGVALGRADAGERRQGVEGLAKNCRLGEMIGARVLVLHLWGWPELDDNLDNNLELLSECLDLTERYGMQLAIETIPCRQRDPLSNVLRAIERDPRAMVALDTEFLALYKQLEEVFRCDWLWERVRHVHIKDFNGQSFSADGKRRYLHPGEGEIDFGQFFAGLAQRGFAGNISLEAPAIDGEGQVNVGRLQASLDRLRQELDGQTFA